MDNRGAPHFRPSARDHGPLEPTLTGTNSDNNNVASSAAYWHSPMVQQQQQQPPYMPRIRQLQPTTSSSEQPQQDELFRRTRYGSQPQQPPPLSLYAVAPPPSMNPPPPAAGSRNIVGQDQLPTDTGRPPVAASQNPSTGTRRTRITRACDTCRRKKIKCDVDSVFPCTTCRQYDWDCTFNDTAKKRGPPKGYIENLETRLKKMEKLLEQLQSDKADEGATEANNDNDNQWQKKRKRSVDEEVEESSEASSLSPKIPAAAAAEQQTFNKFADRSNKVVRYLGSASGYYLMRNMLSPDNNKGGRSSVQQQSGTAAAANNAVPSTSEPVFAFPDKNGKCRIRKVDLFDDDLVMVRDTTEAENASQLTIEKQEQSEGFVPREILAALVKCYFDMPNVTLPIINKEQFLDAFEGRTSPAPSPLLTYSICAYACFMLRSDDPIFKQLDVDRDQVFQTLIDRASRLVRQEYLIPRISTIQALVILCSQPTYSTSSYRNWILAGMAVRMAQDLGLHRTFTVENASKEYVEYRKRLWYSVYVTDRWCCAVMGRPLAIADSDCDVELPDPKGTGNEDLTIFVNFVKLSGILGEVLRRIYSPKAKAAGYKTLVMEQTVASLERMLDDWFNQLTDDCRVTAADLAAIHQNPQNYVGSMKLTQGGALTICFHAVTLLLFRPFIVSEDESPSGLYSAATKRCMDAAKMIIDIARVVPTAYITRFGWNFSAYAVFQAALIHVYNCTSSDPKIAQMSHEYVRVSKDDCLAALSRDIPYGPPVLPFLEKLIGLLNADGTENGNNRKETSEPPPPSATEDSAAPVGGDSAIGAPAAPPAATESPMSLQQMMINLEDATTSDKPETGAWMYPGSSSTVVPPSLTQADWQQLFSSAGTFFTEDNTGAEMQAWTSVLFGNQAMDPTMFMQ